MPRFLDIVTGRFVWRDNAGDVVYAILSHTWRLESEGGEQSYDDVRKLQAEVEAKGSVLQAPASTSDLATTPAMSNFDTAPRDADMPNDTMPDHAVHDHAVDALRLGPTIFSHHALSNKIQGVCNVARKAGYRLLWNDACCIDRSSSAELSEAINSMYEWYRLADVCYVYLQDVPDGNIPDDITPQFAKSKWHRRGWTLQELIAPKRVVFLTQSWRFFGTKLGLAADLERISGVPSEVLTGLASLDSISVARRMSWAARRDTTRVEDRAYSLMGLFGVHMSTIYGEGHNAFLRLQEEIMKTIPDQSIFAWGRSCRLLSLDHPRSRAIRYGPYSLGLLANSPRDFEHFGGVNTLSPAQFASRLGRRMEDIPPLHCVFTSQGVDIGLLCIDLAPVPTALSASLWSEESACDSCLRLGRAHALAVLQCEDEENSLITLPLCRPEVGSHRGLLIGSHVRCSAAANRRNMNGHEPLHIIRLASDALAEALEYISSEPVPVSLLRYHSASAFHEEAQSPTLGNPTSTFWSQNKEDGDTFHIRVAPRCREELGALGFSLSSWRCKRSELRKKKITLSLSLIPNPNSARALGVAGLALQISLVLTDRSAKWTFSSFASSNSLFGLAAPPDVKARFTVTGGNCTILSNAADGSWSANSRHNSSLLRQPVGNGHAVHTSRFHSESFNTKGTPVDAEFIVMTNDGSHDLTMPVRLLRISLERSRENSDDPLRRVAWLSVELSSTIQWSSLVRGRFLPRVDTSPASPNVEANSNAEGPSPHQPSFGSPTRSGNHSWRAPPSPSSSSTSIASPIGPRVVAGRVRLLSGHPHASFASYDSLPETPVSDYSAVRPAVGTFSRPLVKLSAQVAALSNALTWKQQPEAVPPHPGDSS